MTNSGVWPVTIPAWSVNNGTGFSRSPRRPKWKKKTQRRFLPEELVNEMQFVSLFALDTGSRWCSNGVNEHPRGSQAARRFTESHYEPRKSRGKVSLAHSHTGLCCYCSGKNDEPEDLAAGLVIGKRCFPALINVVTGPSLWFAWRLRRHAGTSWQAIRQTFQLEWVQSNRTVFLSRRSVSVGRREFSRTVRCFHVLWLWPVIFGDLLGRHLLQPQCWIHLQLHCQPLKYKKRTQNLCNIWTVSHKVTSETHFSLLEVQSDVSL